MFVPVRSGGESGEAKGPSLPHVIPKTSVVACNCRPILALLRLDSERLPQSA